ncbi:Uncharacterised protein [uncultured archaeon]|nr:Uncharacterised protein [uncultured archaeon]
MKNAVIALALVSFLLFSGCTFQPTGGNGMQPPHVCENFCPIGETQAPYPGCECSGGSGGRGGQAHFCDNLCGIGQTQAPYPDCSCSGGGGGGGQGHFCGNLCGIGETQAPYPSCTCSGGNGGGGLNPVGVCPNLCPISTSQSPYPNCGCYGGGITYTGGGGVGVVNPVSYGGGLLMGGEASNRTTQGAMLVVFTAKNGGASPFGNITAVVGRVSAYLEGAGAGWVFVSTGNKTVDFQSLGNKSEEVAFNRMWVGKYARLAIEFISMNATYRESQGTLGALLPANGYAFVMMSPVSESAISAVELVFDVNKSFVPAANGSGLEFRPSVEVRSINNAEYLLKDDGSVDIYSGNLSLSELASFDAQGNSGYQLLGGESSQCVYNCTAGCAQPQDPQCNYNCALACMGEPVNPRYNRCDDGTPFGYCSDRKPWLCLTTNKYFADCVACGCNFGQQCDSHTGTCGAINETCYEVTLVGQCFENNKPYKCSQGFTSIADCRSCGCPSGKYCQADGSCTTNYG